MNFPEASAKITFEVCILGGKYLKRCVISILVTTLLMLSFVIRARAIDNPAFFIRIEGKTDTINSQSTFIVDWQVAANQAGTALINTQGLRLAYDNTVFQLMRWDGSAVVGDESIGVTFAYVQKAVAIGEYNCRAFAYAARDESGHTGYLNLMLGDPFEKYECAADMYVSLLRARFAFRAGKSASDLASGSIRLMAVDELHATYQSSAILISTDQKGGTFFEYLRQAGGKLLGGDALNAPEFVYLGCEVGGGSPDVPVEPPKAQEKPADVGKDQLASQEKLAVSSIKPSNAVEVLADDRSRNGNDGRVGETGGADGADGADGTGAAAVGIAASETSRVANLVTSYEDVDEAAWYAQAVRFVSENGLMVGTYADHFSPDILITRAMLATVIHRMAGQPPTDNWSLFADVPEGQWYSGAIAWAKANEVILGYGDGLFGLHDYATREQVVAILCRSTAKKELDASGYGILVHTSRIK